MKGQWIFNCTRNWLSSQRNLRMILKAVLNVFYAFPHLSLIQFWGYVGLMCSQWGKCILFSVVFTPSPPQPLRQCFGPACHLPSLYSGIAGADLPNHMMIEVSWDPKKKSIVGLLVLNSLWVFRSVAHTFLIDFQLMHVHDLQEVFSHSCSCNQQTKLD